MTSACVAFKAHSTLCVWRLSKAGHKFYCSNKCTVQPFSCIAFILYPVGVDNPFAASLKGTRIVIDSLQVIQPIFVVALCSVLGCSTCSRFGFPLCRKSNYPKYSLFVVAKQPSPSSSDRSNIWVGNIFSQLIQLLLGLRRLTQLVNDKDVAPLEDVYYPETDEEARNYQVLVVGATGRIGNIITKKLLLRGYRVRYGFVSTYLLLMIRDNNGY